MLTYAIFINELISGGENLHKHFKMTEICTMTELCVYKCANLQSDGKFCIDLLSPKIKLSKENTTILAAALEYFQRRIRLDEFEITKLSTLQKKEHPPNVFFNI